MTKLTKMDRMVMTEVNKACENMENYRADGTVNWDYVDADVYMAIAADDPVTKEMLNQYNAAFNRYVDVIQTAIDMKIAV
jgi:hypothetical protein